MLNKKGGYMLIYLKVFDVNKTLNIEKEEIAEFLIKKFGDIEDCSVVMLYYEVDGSLNPSLTCSLVNILPYYEKLSEKYFEDIVSFFKEKNSKVIVILGEKIEEIFEVFPN
ncbi:MAG: hypothetical protein PHP37_01205 [Patescibacteria group bacterium]|nr:hypothetical protein [Patescibacteria group bacterium]